ncbi:uncharacterized protein LOC144632980 isoform X2 [Oculina patagonica]
MNSLLRTLSLSAIIFLSSIQRGDPRPPPCKDGNKFYEESVFDYFNCSICIEQSHYSNCDVCCTVAVTPTTPLTTLMTTPVSIFGFKLPSSSEASEIVASVPNGVFMKAEVLIIIAFFIGFLTMFGIAVFAVFTVKYYRKKRKQKKLGSSSE